MLGATQLRTVVKENLRSMRFLARELKGSVLSADRHNRWLPQPAVTLTSAVAELSDSALSRLESAALGFVSADPAARSGTGAPRALASYFPLGSMRANPGREAIFARDQYAAAKRVLSGRGAANPSISEIAFAQAYRQIAASPEAQNSAEPHAMAAAVALAVAATRPIAAPARLVEEETGTVRDANRFIAAVLGLGLAVSSTSDEKVTAGEAYAAAASAVDIGWEAVEAAFAAGAGAGPELARLFEEWSPHLP